MSKAARYRDRRAVKRAWLAATALGATLATGAPAFAQDVEVDRSDVRDVMTVTAQRRAQDVQDVPITISIVSDENINALAADNISDIDVFVPGLQIGAGSPTQPRFEIRGIRTNDFGIGTDPAVGVYIDDVYAARTGASLLAFNDVERIEVIKGPQGTLFGRNSAAGAVAITTNKPSQELEAKANLRFGNFGKRRFEGLLNVPLTDELAIRLNGVINRRNGLLIDDATGEDLRTEANSAFRVALQWEPTDATTAYFSYIHDEIDQDARPAIGIVPIPPAPGQPPVPPDESTFISPLSAPVFNDVVGNSERRNLDDFTLTITHDFSNITVTSITNYRHFETNNREDEDGTNRIDLYFDTNNVEDNESFYQELRAAGELGRFDWLVGASYNKENAFQASRTFLFTDTLDTLFNNTEGLALFTLLNDLVLEPNGVDASPFGLPWSEDMVNEGDFESFAVFADVIYNITDNLSLTAGARYTRDEKRFSWFNGLRDAPELDALAQQLEADGFLPFLGFGASDIQTDAVFDLSGVAGVPCDNGVTAGEGVLCVLEDDFEDVSPRFVLNYEAWDDVTFFASFAEGYKAGGFNSTEVASRFENEDVRNYEVGVKSYIPSANLLFNASVFYFTYLDRQAIRLVPADQIPGSNVPQYLVATSDEEAYGVDVQTEWTPLEGLSFNASAQYIDLTFKEFTTRGGLVLDGQPVGEPNWSVVGGMGYLHDLGSHGEIEFFASHAFEGATRCNDDSVTQGDCLGFATFDPGEARNRTDLRLYWRSENDRVQLGLFANNVFDNIYADGVNRLTADVLGTPFSSISEPRFFGGDIELRY